MQTVSLDMESTWEICHQTNENNVTSDHEKKEILSSVTTWLILEYME